MENDTSGEKPQINHKDTSKEAMETTRVQGDPQIKKTNTKPWKGVLYALLIKENPPDLSPHSPIIQTQGKVLDSQDRKKPNLLSLGAGKLVLRTKPFEEGGYDGILDRRTLKTKHGLDSVVEFSAKYTKDKGETNFLGKHVEDKGETNFLDMFQLPKLNDSPNTQAAEPDSRGSLQQPSLENHEDIQVLIKALQTTHRELSYEVNLCGFLTQQVESSKLNQPNRSPDLKDMNFRSCSFCAEAVHASALNIELHSPAQNRPLLRTTWRMFLGLLWFLKAQEHVQTPADPPDTLQSKRWVALVPFKASPGSSCLKSLQTYVWRPGERVTHLGASQEALPCSSTHRIRWILPLVEFPYPAKPLISPTAPRSMALLSCPLDI